MIKLGNINYYTNSKYKCFNKKAITKSHCISNDNEGGNMG